MFAACQYPKIFTAILLALPLITWASAEPQNNQHFTFQYQGLEYSGLIQYPKSEPTALVVIIPGHGKTDLVNGEQWNRERNFFLDMGLSVVVWDRAGCGDSEGEYNHHQSVQSSAEEARAALAKIRKLKVPGSHKTGYWGLSRAGWIVPLAIRGDKDIAFWISVGGTDQYETFPYMLASNYRLQGNSEKAVKQLMQEWDFAWRAMRGDTSYKAFLEGTQMLAENTFLKEMGFSIPDKREYRKMQKHNRNNKGTTLWNEQNGREIIVPGFAKLLSELNIPVLALFGELDSQVDWRGAKSLYEHSIGNKPQADLSIKVFPKCSHAMFKCETGAYGEDLSQFGWEACEGYLDTMKNWLIKQRIAKP